MCVYLLCVGVCVVPKPAVATSPGNLLEMHILRPHARPTESETLGVGPSPPGDPDACPGLRTS